MKTEKDTRKVITKKKNNTPIYIHFILYDTVSFHIDSFKVIEWWYGSMKQLAVKDVMVDKKTFIYDDDFVAETDILSRLEYTFGLRSRLNERLEYYLYYSEEKPFNVEGLEQYLRSKQRKKILIKLDKKDYL